MYLPDGFLISAIWLLKFTTDIKMWVIVLIIYQLPKIEQDMQIYVKK